MAYLALVRHGESEWNKLGLWTGLTNVNLTKEGKEESKKAGEALKDINFDIAYTSPLKRAKETLEEIKKVLNAKTLPTFENDALIERDYGILTGKNKWEIKKEVGDEKFFKIRRYWNEPIKYGETLKDVYERAVPFIKDTVLPQLKENKNILISTHGNNLRAIIKFLENIPDDKVCNLETATGEVYVYDIDENGKIISKEIRAENSKKGKQ